MKIRLIAPSLMLAVLVLSNCSHTTAITSDPATADILIDGDRAEWMGKFSMPKDAKLAVAVSHTRNYVYLAISSLDPALQRLLSMNGFTIWLDPAGKKHEIFGIKYAGRRAGRIPSESDFEAQGVGRGLEAEDYVTGGKRQPRMKPLSGDLDLIVLDADKRESLGPSDLLASARTTEAGLFLEIQIPLALLGKDYLPGSRLGIGLDSSFDRPDRMERNAMDGGMDDASGDMGRGQRPGAGMGGGRGGAGMGGQRPGGMTGSDLELWLRVDFSRTP